VAACEPIFDIISGVTKILGTEIFAKKYDQQRKASSQHAGSDEPESYAGNYYSQYPFRGTDDSPYSQKCTLTARFCADRRNLLMVLSYHVGLFYIMVLKITT